MCAQIPQFLVGDLLLKGCTKTTFDPLRRSPPPSCAAWPAPATVTLHRAPPCCGPRRREAAARSGGVARVASKGPLFFLSASLSKGRSSPAAAMIGLTVLHPSLQWGHRMLKEAYAHRLLREGGSHGQAG